MQACSSSMQPIIEQVGDGDGLVAVRAPPADSQLAHECPAFGTALLTKGAYATRFALINAHRSARPAGGNLDNGAGGDLVSPSPCGCPARVAAVLLVGRRGEAAPADGAASRRVPVTRRDLRRGHGQLTGPRSESPGGGATSIASPLRRPRFTCTARSSPRRMRSRTVCRATPSV